MYQFLLSLHSFLRWLVVISLFTSVVTAYCGYIRNLSFSKPINSLRHWTATIAHIQLMAGIILYSKSPWVKTYFAAGTSKNPDPKFFGVIHAVLMLAAIILLTVGSAITKRKETDKEKFRTMMLWYTIALLLILIAVPWPFSPLAQRPYIRNF